MKTDDLNEVVKKYLTELDTIEKKTAEINEIQENLPEIKADKNGRYTVEAANQLIQNALKIEAENKLLQGLKDDHETTRINIENLLKKIPNIKVDLGKSYLVFEKVTGDSGRLQEYGPALDEE